MTEWVEIWQPYGLAGLVIGVLFVLLGYGVRQYTKLANHHSSQLMEVIERNNAALDGLKDEMADGRVVMTGVKDALNRIERHLT